MAWECFGTLGFRPSRASIFMYLLYTDASGTPELQDNSGHYVSVGLCLHEGSWFALTKQLDSLAQRYGFPGIAFELHVKEFAMTISEQGRIPNFEQLSRADRRTQVEEVRKKLIDQEATKEAKQKRRDKYRTTERFIHLTRRERSALLEDAVDVIAGYEKVKLFGEAIHKRHPQVIANNINPVEQAFTQVVSRFDTYLEQQARWRQNTQSRIPINHGLLILDNDDTTEDRIQNLFQQFRAKGHTFGQLRHVLDVPFFAESDRVAGLQFADVCAYVVRRYLDTGAKPGSHEERQFRKIFQRFDRGTDGRLHGLRHYVASNSCDCLICRERGHAKLPNE
jgi:hypothetical protein